MMKEMSLLKNFIFAIIANNAKNSILSDPSPSEKIFGHSINISNIGMLETLRLMNLTENLRLDQLEIRDLECRAPQ